MNFLKNNKIFQKIERFYNLKILKKKYYRYGACKCCGACCENIYVRHKNNIIKTKEEFERIKQEDNYSFYRHIDIIGSDNFGLLFACRKFDKINKLCTDHKNRPSICSKYPSEEIFKMGACLQEDCGYYFKPIENFEQVFKKISKKPVKNFEISK